jgi:CheY-like chemotaxis protein
VRAVVCEDDPGVRTVIATLAAQHHHEVLAETDNSREAIELVERFGADMLVLDLVLQAGSGTAALESIARGDTPPVHVVVFSAFADGVLPSHDVSIIEKPDFDSLASAFARLSETTEQPSTVERRRRPEGYVVRPHERRAGPGGDDPHDFYTALSEARPGDALLAVAVLEDDAAADKLVAVAKSVARVQDRLLRRASGCVLLLVGGSAEAPNAVSLRLSHTWRELHSPDSEIVTASLVLAAGDEPIDQFGRVWDELESARPVH